MEWIFIIAIGFICIAYPIILFLYIWYMPVSVIVIYFIWLLGSIASIALSKGNNKKWYEEGAIAFLLTVIFTIIFVGSIDTDHYMFDENNAMWFLAPTLCLPMIIFVGCKLKSSVEKSRLEKQEQCIKELNNEKIKLESEILTLRVQLRSCDEINRFLNLLGNCGCDVEALYLHPQMSKIKMLSDEIESKRRQVNELKEKARKCQYNM